MLPVVSLSDLPILEKVSRFCKERRQELLVLGIVVIVALLSFGLGYTMAQDSSRTPIIIEKISGK